ncbi:MAG: uracil-DNA glycosylase [Myxococcota bacterium]
MRDAYDLQYVARGTLPAAALTPAAAAPAPSPTTARRPAQPSSSPATAPRSAPSQPPRAAPQARSGGDQPRVDAKAALRAQAESWSAATKLEYLRKKNLGDCKRCALCQRRQNIVFGVGDAEANIMFVGEAPGADEDRTGEPFVGKAGQLLDRWLVDLGLGREQVYIANVLKCRPPNNRDPQPVEVERCSPFLRAQIRAIQPKVVVALGRHAGMLLSRREDMSLRAMRSAQLDYDATSPKEPPRSMVIPLIVTYHPAYVLRQNGDGEVKATQMVMNDLRKAVGLSQRG